MFGKTKETSDVDERAGLDLTIDDFFGDENAVAEAVRVDHLHQRVTQVEQQISSQFTSLAAYSQIAQEQVELVRSEAQHVSERGEQRVIGLIERERADRIESSFGGGTDVSARLDSLDAQVAEIRDGLQQCLSNQKALADAITELFAPVAADAIPVTPTPAAPAVPTTPEPEPMMSTAMPAPLTATPALSSQDPTLPPPPVESFSFDALDRELEALGIDVREELDTDALSTDALSTDEPDTDEPDTDEPDTEESAMRDLVAIEPIESDAGLFIRPIDGLSLT